MVNLGTLGADLKSAARGRWPDLMRRLGVDENYLSGRHGPCPMCGGTDRWRFTDHNADGMWICNQCGSGDGFDLLMAYHGWGFREAKKAVGELIPEAVFTKPEKDRDESARKALNKIRAEIVAAKDVPEVVRYLQNRGLVIPPMLQAHPGLPYYVDGEVVATYPAMVGRAVTKSGRPVTYHRTYIRDGKKAPVDSPRKMMRTVRKAKGYAIKLWPAEGKVCIAEGIETAIACYMLWGVPAWSVVSANQMIDWEVPDGIEEIIIAGDNDENYTGQAAAYEKARRLKMQGYQVDVQIPPHVGDWNDMLEMREVFNAA